MTLNNIAIPDPIIEELGALKDLRDASNSVGCILWAGFIHVGTVQAVETIILKVPTKISGEHEDDQIRIAIDWYARYSPEFTVPGATVLGNRSHFGLASSGCFVKLCSDEQTSTVLLLLECRLRLLSLLLLTLVASRGRGFFGRGHLFLVEFGRLNVSDQRKMGDR